MSGTIPCPASRLKTENLSPKVIMPRRKNPQTALDLRREALRKLLSDTEHQIHEFRKRNGNPNPADALGKQYKNLIIRLVQQIERVYVQFNVVTCVYCGHEYPPGTPTSGSNIMQLTEHIKVCEEHPMRALEDELRRACRNSTAYQEQLLKTETALAEAQIEIKRLRLSRHKLCQHRMVHHFSWGIIGDVEVCEDCLFTRLLTECTTGNWQDHGYQNVKDAVAEGEKALAEIDKELEKPKREGQPSTK